MSWYQNGLKFECTKCGHCCTGGPGYVWIQVEDMHRIAEFLGFPAQWDPKLGIHVT